MGVPLSSPFSIIKKMRHTIRETKEKEKWIHANKYITQQQ